MLIKYRPIIIVGLWCYNHSGVTELLIMRDPHYCQMCFKSVKTLILSCGKSLGLGFFTVKNVELLGLYPIHIRFVLNMLIILYRIKLLGLYPIHIRFVLNMFVILYKIKPEELYILGCEKGRGQRAFSQLIKYTSDVSLLLKQ